MSTNRNILVIGGTSGIGLAIADNLRQKGYQVLSASRKMGDKTSDHLVFDAVKDELPVASLPETLHGLVYCPGSINLKPFHRLSDQDFLDDFQVNCLGAARSIRAALPLLKNSENASIVLFSTVAVNQGMSFHASIAAAKGAVEGLTKSLAAELAPKIRVNAIAPSLTNTPLASKLISSEEKIKASADRHPLKRIGTPADIASLACYLLSEESSWMTGQILHADGGLTSVR